VFRMVINGFRNFYGEESGLNGKNIWSLPCCIIYKGIIHVKRGRMNGFGKEKISKCIVDNVVVKQSN